MGCSGVALRPPTRLGVPGPQEEKTLSGPLTSWLFSSRHWSYSLSEAR